MSHTGCLPRTAVLAEALATAGGKKCNVSEYREDLNARLLNRQSKSTSIPPLRAEESEWMFDAEDKANLLAISWDMKN